MTTTDLPATAAPSHTDTAAWLLAHDPLRIEWADEPKDLGGYPRSDYVEVEWLPVLGPTCIMAMRRFALWLDVEPLGFTVAQAQLATSLGLSAATTRNSAVIRALARLIQFRWAAPVNDTLTVVRLIPELTTKEARRRERRMVRP